MQDLSADEIIGITQIREGKVSVGVVTLIGKEKFEQLIMDASANMLRKEVAQYSTGKSILSSTHARDLAKFDINKVSDEFQQRLPKTVQTIKSIALRDQEGKQKTHASVSPAVTSVICKCLGIYSERLSAYRYGMSSFLSLGGLKQQSVDQLARLYDAMSTSSRDTKNKQYAEIFDETKQQWKDSDVTFQIGFDNVDKRIGRREQTKLSPGKLHHMVQAVAIRDRVIANPGPPAFPIQSVDPDLLLPTEDDIGSVTEGFADMLRETWADMIPALEWMRPKQYKHQYSEQMKAKSEKVCMLTNLSVTCNLTGNLC